MSERKDITALVTGGSSGIGLEYARQLTGRGCKVIVVSNREQELEEAAKELNVLPVFLDLAQDGCAQRLLDWCDERNLSIDILINNAGMFFTEYLSEKTIQKAHTMMNLHMQTATELCILFGSRMKAQGTGYILNMSSMTAEIPAPGIAVYSASKAYLKSFGRSFSYEMRPFGVKVTTVCPAAIDTGLYPIGPGLRKALRRLGIIRSPRWLVRRAVRALFRGRRTISPGLTTLLVPALVALMPPRLIDRLGMKWIYR